MGNCESGTGSYAADRESARIREAGSIAVEALESKFAVGDPVKHPKFGAGTVLGAHGIVIDVAFYGPAGRRSVVDSFLDAGI